MPKQMFVLTMEIPAPFDRYLPKVEAELIANIIHDNIKAKNTSFTGSIPLTLRVKRIGEEASTYGQILTKRIIPCLYVKSGRVVKGTSFVELRDAGDPLELASFYCKEGADELVFLDITATPERRDTMVDVVERISKEIFVPLTVGGGLRNTSDILRMLRAGANKVAINTAAILKPDLITESAAKFGTQCIVVAIDAKRVETFDGPWWQVYICKGQRLTGFDAVGWAARASALGAGELLVTSIDAHGHRVGYDIELIRTISEVVTVPVIACGGADSLVDLHRALAAGKADAVLVGGNFYYGTCSINEIKGYLAKQEIPMRIKGGV
jgi:cyclase